MLADLAEAAADAGDLGRAQELARSISDPARQAEALAYLAEAAAGAGDLNRARNWLSKPRQQPSRSSIRADRRRCWRTWC